MAGSGEVGAWHPPALRMWAKTEGWQRETGRDRVVGATLWRVQDGRLRSSDFIHQQGMTGPEALLDTDISGIGISELAHLQNLLWQWLHGVNQSCNRARLVIGRICFNVMLPGRPAGRGSAGAPAGLPSAPPGCVCFILGADLRSRGKVLSQLS